MTRWKIKNPGNSGPGLKLGKNCANSMVNFDDNELHEVNDGNRENDRPGSKDRSHEVPKPLSLKRRKAADDETRPGQEVVTEKDPASKSHGEPDAHGKRKF